MALAVREAIDTPIGVVTVVALDGHVVRVRFPDGPVDAVEAGSSPVGDRPGAPDELVVRKATDQLAEYFAAARTSFDLPLRVEGGEFEREVWGALATIPYGQTISYGEQAKRIGKPPGAARAVGAANGRNPLPIVLPCHRVIGADGSLTGFGGGLAVKQWLLDHEAGTQRLPF